MKKLTQEMVRNAMVERHGESYNFTNRTPAEQPNTFEARNIVNSQGDKVYTDAVSANIEYLISKFSGAYQLFRNTAFSGEIVKGSVVKHKRQQRPDYFNVDGTGVIDQNKVNRITYNEILVPIDQEIVIPTTIKSRDLTELSGSNQGELLAATLESNQMRITVEKGIEILEKWSIFTAAEAARTQYLAGETSQVTIMSGTEDDAEIGNLISNKIVEATSIDNAEIKNGVSRDELILVVNPKTEAHLRNLGTNQFQSIATEGLFNQTYLGTNLFGMFQGVPIYTTNFVSNQSLADGDGVVSIADDNKTQWVLIRREAIGVNSQTLGPEVVRDPYDIDKYRVNFKMYFGAAAVWKELVWIGQLKNIAVPLANNQTKTVESK